MKPDECREAIAVSKIKLEEKGRKAIFNNLGRETYIKTRVDGCLLVNETASDWVLSKKNIGDVIVELKGRDVDHAVEQVTATADFWKEKGFSNGHMAALIVCAQYPRIDTKIQRATQAFSKKHKAPLHVVSRNSEYLFNDVLRFDGPFRVGR